MPTGKHELTWMHAYHTHPILICTHAHTKHMQTNPHTRAQTHACTTWTRVCTHARA